VQFKLSGDSGSALSLDGSWLELEEDMDGLVTLRGAGGVGCGDSEEEAALTWIADRLAVDLRAPGTQLLELEDDWIEPLEQALLLAVQDNRLAADRHALWAMLGALGNQDKRTGIPLLDCPQCQAGLVVEDGTERFEARCPVCDWTRGGRDYLAACGSGGPIGAPDPDVVGVRPDGTRVGFKSKDTLFQETRDGILDVERRLERLNPDNMHGAGDGFGGEDFPSG
jgi:hypothetical protein